jgi:hypothetical protein
MNGFYGPIPSRREMEIEAEFDRAFFLLLHTPEVSSIDISVSSMPEDITLWRLEELSEHYGLELEFHAPGHVSIRRTANTEMGKVNAPPSRLGFAVKEANAIRHWLGHEGSTVRRRLAGWNFGRRPVAH